jgi:uncharacterized protein YbaA (DUF1428 family)
MVYVDGFVLPVPKKALAAYRRMAGKAGKLWVEHGALEFRECVADDLVMQMPDGSRVDSLFPAMAKAKRGEAVLFSYIKFKSRAHRDRVNKKVMADPRMAAMGDGAMPFDVTRMAYGGFRTLVER